MDLTVIIITVVYIGFIFAIGVMTSKGVHNTDDFLVAGRDVRWFSLACTIGATVVGGGYAIGAVGETYELGLLMLFASMGGYLQFVFAGFVVAPKFRKAKVYTVAGYMEGRFGEGPRLVSLVLSLLFSLFVIAAQMAAIGHVLAAMFPDLAEGQTLIKLAVIVGGVIVIIYSAAGGLKAVILTDVFQFLVLIAGFLITAALVLPEVSMSFDASLGKLPAHFFDPHPGQELDLPRGPLFDLLVGGDLCARVRDPILCRQIQKRPPDRHRRGGDFADAAHAGGGVSHRRLRAPALP